jgi:hypothetical protein|tara:strand:- start:10 stop:210 length:201 start_codon:yes stop_codon:yes gene_type:complete
LAVSYLAGRLYGTWAIDMGGFIRAFAQLAVELLFYASAVIVIWVLIIMLLNFASPQGITNDFIWNP